MSLTAKQKLFVDEYLVDLNATQAAIRAGYSEKTANEQGARLLANVSVKEQIDERMKDREKRTEITQDMVLHRYWQIATADPRKLIEYRRCACRYCYGKYHQYQWRDEQEFAEEYQRAVELQEKYFEQDDEAAANAVVFPNNKGGYGFNPTYTPHPKCPKCFGDGHGEAKALDTRQFDAQSAMLYAGVKVTREGIEIKMQDQLKALESVAKHLGMFVDKQEVKHSGQIETKQTIDTSKLSTEQLRTIAGIPINAG